MDDMCTPQGLRAQPDREALRVFVENAASMNGPQIAQHLQAKMVRHTCQQEDVGPSICTQHVVMSQQCAELHGA